MITNLIHKIPGHKRFGVLTIMPFFFFMGAALEFSMIKWKPNGVNFYEVYERKELEKLEVELQDLSQIQVDN